MSKALDPFPHNEVNAETDLGLYSRLYFALLHLFENKSMGNATRCAGSADTECRIQQVAEAELFSLALENSA